MFNDITLCQEALNWMMSNHNCRRRALFSIVDNVVPSPCILTSRDKKTWCDICCRISVVDEDEHWRGDSENPDVSTFPIPEQGLAMGSRTTHVTEQLFSVPPISVSQFETEDGKKN